MRERRRPISRGYAWLIVRLRLVIVLGWIALAVWVTLSLPSVNPQATSRLTDLVPKDAPALAAEIRSNREFKIPLLSREVIVQRGLTLEQQAETFDTAVAVDTGKLRPKYPSLLGAIPISNSISLLPSPGEHGSTTLTYVFTAPNLSLAHRVDLVDRFAREHLSDGLVGQTGLAPAQLEQGRLIAGSLRWVEIATVIFIALLVGITFRSIGAPLVTLATAGIAYEVAIRAMGWAGNRFGIDIPGELHPLVVVLLLGLSTDYSVFFLSGMRARLATGEPALDAARATTVEFGHIILTAGLIVAAGTAALLVASIELFRSLGPGLAFTVLVGLAVGISFAPAAIALFGRALYWPRAPMVASGAEEREGPHTEKRPTHTPLGWRASAMRVATVRPVAVLLVLVFGGALGVVAFQSHDARLGVPLIAGLPNDTGVARAADAVAAGFVPGALSPLEILLEGPGVTQRLPGLQQLGRSIDRRSEVAAVIGPNSLPTSFRDLVPDLVRRAFLSENGNAARLLIIMREDPLSGSGLQEVRALRAAVPSMLDRAGLSGVRVSWVGDAALAAETIDQTLSDLLRVGLAAALIALVLLILFLRALITPVLLVAASVLSVFAAMGLTVLFFEGLLHSPGIAYYVPFAAGVLLISLGSDYNVFIVGRIWSEAERRPMRDAIVTAVPLASRAITLAGLALAGSFALLALIPVLAFRQLAFMLAVGVLIDSFLIRSALVPALLAVLRSASEWPFRRLGRARERTGTPAPAADPSQRAS